MDYPKKRLSIQGFIIYILGVGEILSYCILTYYSGWNISCDVEIVTKNDYNTKIVLLIEFFRFTLPSTHKSKCIRRTRRHIIYIR